VSGFKDEYKPGQFWKRIKVLQMALSKVKAREKKVQRKYFSGHRFWVNELSKEQPRLD